MKRWIQFTNVQPVITVQEINKTNQGAVPCAVYCIFFYHTTINKHNIQILIYPYFNHLRYYRNKLDTATCTGLNTKFRSHLLIYFSTVVYSIFYEFYIIGLKMTVLGPNMLPE